MVVINCLMVECFWLDDELLGKFVRVQSMESYWYDGQVFWFCIVGVVDDMCQYGFEDDFELMMFMFYWQILQLVMSLVVVVCVCLVLGFLFDLLQRIV